MSEAFATKSPVGKGRRRFLGAAAGGLVLIALTVVFVVRSRRAAPIRIAFANSLTGVAASAGTESLIGTQLYIDEINRSGGINGHPVELVMFDDASSPDTARANANKIPTATASLCWVIILARPHWRRPPCTRLRAFRQLQARPWLTS
jgi:ABC-type branched-subunit amino acid transport system substrate-binding protein